MSYMHKMSVVTEEHPRSESISALPSAITTHLSPDPRPQAMAAADSGSDLCSLPSLSALL